jgi:hypothetical protein
MFGLISVNWRYKYISFNIFVDKCLFERKPVPIKRETNIMVSINYGKAIKFTNNRLYIAAYHELLPRNVNLSVQISLMW